MAESMVLGVDLGGTHMRVALVDEKGVILKVFTKPKSKMHAEEILEAIG